MAPSGPDPEDWEELSPWLDVWLDTPEPERPALLTRWQMEDPLRAERIRPWLGELAALTQAGFMAGGASSLMGSAHPGQVVGAYTLLSLLGEGGMGQVWRAQRSDERFQADVAIKFLSRTRLSEADTLRFQREGLALGRLNHPHIAQLLDAGVTPEGAPYLVMEHVAGQPLDVAATPLPQLERLRLFSQVLAAVSHAHSRLVLHRDLKPSNILVTDEGQVKLLDFGIAKLLDDHPGRGDSSPHPPQSGTADSASITQLAGQAFTPRYAAPEQLLGDEVTQATDVYALGVLLYELLSGRHPTHREHDAPASRVQAVLHIEPRPLSSFTAVGPVEHLSPGSQGVLNAPGRPLASWEEAVQRAPHPWRALARHGAARWGRWWQRASGFEADLDTVLASALKKTPAERYRDAAAFAEDVQRLLGHQPILARPDRLTYRLRKALRRHWLPVSAATAVGLALLAGGTVALLQAREAQLQREQAEGLIEFMLGDLRERLEPLDRLDVLDSVAERVLTHYGKAQDTGRLDEAAQMRRVHALHLVVDVALQGGRLDQAEQAAQLALMVSRSWLAPDLPLDPAERVAAASTGRTNLDPQRARQLALHGMGEYWQAYVAEMRQQFQVSTAANRRADAWLTLALALAPQDTDILRNWTLTREALAVEAQRENRLEVALQQFEEVQVAQLRLAASEPQRWAGVASVYAWIADCQHRLHRYEASVRTLALHVHALEQMPDAARTPSLRMNKARGLNRMAGTLWALDRPEQALKASQEAVTLAEQAVRHDPANLENRIQLLFHRVLLAQLHADQGQGALSWEQLAQVAQALPGLRAEVPDSERVQVELMAIQLAARHQLAPLAAGLAEQTQRFLTTLPAPGSPAQARMGQDATLRVIELTRLQGDTLARSGQPEAARRNWRLAQQRLASLAEDSAPRHYEQARLALRLGEPGRAAELARQLQALGYSPRALRELEAERRRAQPISPRPAANKA